MPQVLGGDPAIEEEPGLPNLKQEPSPSTSLPSPFEPYALLLGEVS